MYGTSLGSLAFVESPNGSFLGQIAVVGRRAEEKRGIPACPALRDLALTSNTDWVDSVQCGIVKCGLYDAVVHEPGQRDKKTRSSQIALSYAIAISRCCAIFTPCGGRWQFPAFGHYLPAAAIRAQNGRTRAMGECAVKRGIARVANAFFTLPFHIVLALSISAAPLRNAKPLTGTSACCGLRKDVVSYRVALLYRSYISMEPKTSSGYCALEYRRCLLYP